MIKKIISCLLCLLLISGNAFAAVTTPIDINSETKAFSVNGTSNVTNGEVLLMIAKPNVAIDTLTPELIAAEAAIVYVLETNSQGAYSGQFYLPEDAPSGDYTVYVGSDEPVTFYYADSSEIEKCIEDVTSASLSTIGSTLDYYTNTQKILGLDLGGDYAAYSDAANSVMIDYITKEAPGTIAAIKEYFAKSTEAGVLIGTSSEEKIKAALTQNRIGLAYDSDVSLDNLAKTYLSLRDSSVTTVEKINNTLRCAEALCKVNSATRGEMTNVLNEYNDVLGLNLTGDYSSIDKIEVNKALVGKDFVTIDDVKQSFNKAVREVADEEDRSSGSTGGSGGGGGKINSSINVTGGGSSVPTTPEVPATPTVPSAKFTDLTDAEWAADYINVLCEKNIVNGVGDSRFDPNGTVTREQFVKMILGAFGIAPSSGKTAFLDVDSTMWYAPYVSAAFEYGVASGVSETEFGIGSPITREQMAVMSVRIMEKYGIELSLSDLTFADRAEISSYAYDSVSKLCESGIINGMDESTFAPKAILTRAQAAKVIYLIMKAGGYIA